MYAVIVTGGKQYKVQEGDVLYIEKLEGNDGDAISFNEVVAVGTDGGLTVGAPYVAGASVSATLDKSGKGKKIRIYKMKSKKGYRRRQGHRQPYTKVTIGKISM